MQSAIWRRWGFLALHSALIVSSLLTTVSVPASANGADAANPDPAKAAEALNGSISIKSQGAVEFVPVVEVNAAVPWAVHPIRVDGNLSEWKGMTAAVMLADQKYATWSRGAYGGRDDLCADLFIARDENYLYMAMEILDDKEPAAGRVEVAFADANSPLITAWRDTGQRYGGNDAHMVFSLGGDSVRMSWIHVPARMEASAVNNAFGTEDERREFVRKRDEYAASPKVLSKASRRTEGGKSITSFEAAFPWKLFGPYVPVSYMPLKCNVAVHDNDAENAGVLAWAPGIVGTYSAAHFPNLTFDRPAGRKTVEVYGEVPGFHFVNQDIELTFSFFNPTETPLTGTLEVISTPGDVAQPLLSIPVTVPPGYSQTRTPLHSETIGQVRCSLAGRLMLKNVQPISITVSAPTVDDTFTIQPLAAVQAKIDQLVANTAVLNGLYQQIKAKGLDTAYPQAFVALQEMFIVRCKHDLRGGDSDRVLRNCAYLQTLFASSKAYMEKVLKDPSAQLRVPARVAPDKFVIKNGYYYANEKPVFLWGPCLFWFMRDDQRFAWELGFNSVGPEVPIHEEKSLPEIKSYLQAFYDNGMFVNASIGSSVFDELKKEHPQIANVDSNNFMSVLVQHPIVREEIVKRIQKDIAAYRKFPGVRSYWLWNEPLYSNYSEPTRKDFIEQYLKPKYKNVKALNQRWGSDYKNFDDIQLVKGPGQEKRGPWYDFQQFRSDLLVDFFGFLHKTAKSIDPSRPTHVKYMAMSLDAMNIERLQALGEIAGHDGNAGDRDIIFLDFCRSLYPDRPLSNTEIHIWYRDKPMVESVAWRMALHGLADGNWWCWHPNAKFANTVGSAESMHGLAISGLDVRRLFDPYFYALNQKPRVVATLFPDMIPQRPLS